MQGPLLHGRNDVIDMGFPWLHASAPPTPNKENHIQLYKVLDLPKDATADQIEKHYKILARKCHPDKQLDKTDDSQFKIIKEAYETLVDSERRRLYDDTGFTCEEELMAGLARDPALAHRMQMNLMTGCGPTKPVPVDPLFSPKPPVQV